MAYLIDTNVVSELRKKGKCHPSVRAWQGGVADGEVYISVISMMEIRSGVLRSLRKEPAFGRVLETWYEQQVKSAFEEKVLPVSFAVSECCADVLHQRTRGLADGLIAATALVYGLTLVTRNTADFFDTGVELVNPWL